MLFDIKVSDLQSSVTRGMHKQPYEQESEDLGDKRDLDDEDYFLVFDGDNYDQYGIHDDWLGDMEGKFNESGKWIGAITQGSTGAGFFSKDDMLVEDNEDMYEAVDSDEEAIGHATNSDGERR